MPVPLHQFLSPPFASILTPMSWPCRLGVMFLLGSRAAQDVNYHNCEEVMRCVSNTTAGENSSHRRHASGELPRRKIVYPILTLINPYAFIYSRHAGSCSPDHSRFMLQSDYRFYCHQHDSVASRLPRQALFAIGFHGRYPEPTDMKDLICDKTTAI